MDAHCFIGTFAVVYGVKQYVILVLIHQKEFAMSEFSLDIQTVVKRIDALERELRQLRQSLLPAEQLLPRKMTEHPYVENIPSVLNGEPIIKNTRTPVRAIVERWKFGESPEEIALNLPHLRLAHIFDALSYYDDHREEIEKYIELNRVPVND